MSQDDSPARSVGRPKNPVSRQFLLEKAREAFAQEGFAGASMGDIAERSGLRKSSLFHHFPSKEALYQEVFGLIVSDLGELATEAQQVAEDASFLDRLDKLTEDLVRYLATHSDAAKLLVREFVDEGPFFASSGRRGAHAVLKAAGVFLADGMSSGAIVEQDPDHLVMSLTGLQMMWFAASPVSDDLIEGSVFDEERIAHRVRAVKQQVRLLCGALPA
jgi:TetR/AcrR family transcriptional regulator